MVVVAGKKRTFRKRGLSANEPTIDINVQNTLFAKVEGATYESWITESGRSILGLTASSLIENPAGIIEFIAREYGGLATADVDVDNFDDAYTALSSFAFAGVISEPKNWIAAINEIAIQSKARVYFSNEGLLSISVYDNTADFTQSGTGTPDETGNTNGESDVYIDSDTVDSNNRFKNHLIERGSFSSRYTPVEDIVNEIYLNYFFNYGSNKFQKTTFVTDANSDDGTGLRDITIVAGSNDGFVMTEDVAGTPTTNTVTITAGGYSGATLATEIATQLTAGTSEVITYTGTFDADTQKITLAGDGAKTFTTDFANVSMTSDAITGFTSNPTAATSITSPVEITPLGREDIAALSKTNYSKTTKVIFDAPFIRDDATAVLLRNHLFDLQVNRRLICNFAVIHFTALHLQPGNIINIQHPKLTNKISGMTTKKWEVIGIRKANDDQRVIIEAWELV